MERALFTTVLVKDFWTTQQAMHLTRSPFIISTKTSWLFNADAIWEAHFFIRASTIYRAEGQVQSIAHSPPSDSARWEFLCVVWCKSFASHPPGSQSMPSKQRIVSASVYFIFLNWYLNLDVKHLSFSRTSLSTWNYSMHRNPHRWLTA